MTELPDNILQQAVAKGIIADDQKQAIEAIATTENLQAKKAIDYESERFNLFHSFNEIFLTIGIFILLMPIVSYYSNKSVWFLLVASVIAWVAAEASTRRFKRMILPYMLLAVFFAVPAGFFASFIYLGDESVIFTNHDLTAYAFMIGLIVTILASLAYFARFKVPFSFFIIAVAGLMLLLVLIFDFGLFDKNFFGKWLFGDNRFSQLSWTILGYGLFVFIIALIFDFADPERIKIYSRCAFWLHIMAAPLVVHSLALELYVHNENSILLLIALIVVIMLIAIIIDRRALIVSAFGYIGVIISYAWKLFLGQGAAPVAEVLVSLGIAIIILGFYWHPLRQSLLRLLPDFPGKKYLPSQNIG